VTEANTDAIFDGLRGASAQGTDKALTYVSAFPALEQDVLNYNLSSPSVPLVAIYPKDGSAEADFPYLVLNAEWVKQQQRDVAAAFLRYARGPEGRAAFQEAGLRDGNRVAGPTLVPANGVSQRITALPRAVLLPESVAHAAASWTAITRRTNILFVFDTSGSMGNTVLGTNDQTRLDLTKTAAVNALNLLDGSAEVGVWAFSTTGRSDDWRKLVPMEQLSAKKGNGTQLDALHAAIDGLKSGGYTGLYNTVWAACQEAETNYAAGAANFIVLMTDGADDNNVKDSLTLDQLVNNLRGTCGGAEKPVQIITVGIAMPSESPVLEQISSATKARTFSSTQTFDLNKVLLDFLFS
jgi:Ca-activated chloride channel family protein